MLWQDHLCIGVPEVDEQRHRLFGMVEELKGALHTNRMFEVMGKALKFMVEYANEHFKTEERHMEVIGYPRGHVHKEQHAQLVADIQRILLKMKNDKHVAPSQLMEFMSGWLLQHTLIEDLKIRQFQEQSKLEQAAAKLQAYSEARAAVTESLKHITSRLAKETIVKEAYLAKKSALLNELVQMQAEAPMDEFMERAALIEAFLKEGLIDGAEEKQYKIKLFEAVDLDAELAKRPKSKTKIFYLKSLLAQELITQERFNAYSASIAAAPENHPASGPDVERL